MEDDEIEDRKFDFETWVRDARLGYTELKARRKVIRETVETLLAEEKIVIERSDKVEKMLTAMGIEPEEIISRPRQSNIATVAAEVIEEMFRNPGLFTVDEATLIKAISVRLPFAKEKSIQGALYRLTQANPTKVSRSGKRGSYQYTYSDVEISNPVSDVELASSVS